MSRRSFGSIKKQRSGRYQASYVGPDGARYSAPKTYSARTDADAWLSTQQAAAISGTWTPDTPLDKNVIRAREDAEALALLEADPIFEEFAMRWISERRVKAKPLALRTRQEYTKYVERDFVAFHGRRLSTIAPRDIVEWWDHKLKGGKLVLLEKNYSQLKSMFQTAVEDKNIPLVEINPCQIRGGSTVMKSSRSGANDAKKHLVGDSELEGMINAVEERYKAAISIGAWVGMRSGEVRELRRKDVIVITDSDGTTITFRVERGVTQVTKKFLASLADQPLRPDQMIGEDGYIVGDTKSKAGKRIASIPPHANAVILNHLEKFVDPSPEALLFPAHTSPLRHLSPSTFADYWYPAREAAGRPDIAFHDLRHHAATAYARVGATLKELMDRLGHSTSTAALIYQEISQERTDSLVKMMSDNRPNSIRSQAVEPEEDGNAQLMKQMEALAAQLALSANKPKKKKKKDKKNTEALAS